MNTTSRGSVAISDCGQKNLSADRICSCDKPLELLNEREMWIASVRRLSFAHHVNHLDLTQDRPSGCHRLKSEHWLDLSLDRAMILLEAVLRY
jgi:hypothetical protein